MARGIGSSNWVEEGGTGKIFDADGEVIAELTETTVSFPGRTIIGAGTGGITAVVDDLTPQLGGDLDPNGFNIGGRDTAADGTKLDTVETSATTDQTGAQIKVAYEAEADTNAYNNAAVAKLASIETSATTDQTGAQIKVAYEAEADTNAYTDAAVTKLGAIEAAADVTDTANVTAAGAYMAGGTDIPVTDGGTGSSTASGARSNLDVDQAGTDNAPAASASTAGKVELATITEVNTGTDTARAITPAGLAGSAVQTKLDTIETSATADQTAAEVVVTPAGNLGASDVQAALVELQGDIDTLVGGLDFQGVWNSSTNTPTLASSVGTVGHFYKVSVAGSTTLDGVSEWKVGDALYFGDSVWNKVDNTESVTSVASKTGAVTLVEADITNLQPYYVPGGTDVAVTDGGTGSSTTSGARTNLGVDPAGTDNAPSASSTIAGKVELATITEVNTGTDTVRAITPAGLAGSALATKLGTIETSATADQTAAQIKTAYEGETNAFTDAQFTKLAGIEASATTDQSDAEIRAAVEAATDSNVFTDADHTKLNAVEALADVTDATNVAAAGAIMGNTVGLFADGTALLPSLSFTSDTNTGMYRRAADTIGFSTAGADLFRMDASYLRGNVNYTPSMPGKAAGSVSAPAYSFVGDTNTGMYRGAADEIFFSTGGTEVLRLTTNNIRMAVSTSLLYNLGAVRVGAGSSASPSVTFNSDTNTGMYWVAADQIGFTTGGVLRARFWSGGLLMSTATGAGSMPTGAGTAAAPSYSFYSDTNTGMYRYSADRIGFAAGGGWRMLVSNAEILCSVDIRQDSGDDTGLTLQDSADGNIYKRIDIKQNNGTRKGYVGQVAGVMYLNGDAGVTKVGAGNAITASWDGTYAQMPDAYSIAATSGSYMRVDSNGTIFRYSSSLKYKRDVESLEDTYADKLLEARSVWFRSTSEIDNPEHSYYGFIAEEMAEIDPRFVTWGPAEDCDCLAGWSTDPKLSRDYQHEPGCLEPIGVEYGSITAHLVSIAKRQRDTIGALDERLKLLEEATP